MYGRKGKGNYVAKSYTNY